MSPATTLSVTFKHELRTFRHDLTRHGTQVPMFQFDTAIFISP